MKFLKISLCVVSLLWITGNYAGDSDSEEEPEINMPEFQNRLGNLMTELSLHTGLKPHELTAVADLQSLDPNAADFQTKAAKHCNQAVLAYKFHVNPDDNGHDPIANDLVQLFLNFKIECGFDPSKISESLLKCLFDVYMILFPRNGTRKHFDEEYIYVGVA